MGGSGISGVSKPRTWINLLPGLLGHNWLKSSPPDPTPSSHESCLGPSKDEPFQILFRKQKLLRKTLWCNGNIFGILLRSRSINLQESALSHHGHELSGSIILGQSSTNDLDSIMLPRDQNGYLVKILPSPLMEWRLFFIKSKYATSLLAVYFNCDR